MSTRSCIARLTSKPGEPITFRGKYSHWDGYPSGLGATLFKLWRGHFKKDTNAMLKVLIDDCRCGWSTINGADFNLPAAPRTDDSLKICKICKLPNWRHYKQYYVETNKRWVEAGRPPCPTLNTSSYLVTDHSPQEEDKPHGPECYADNGEINETNETNASGSGVEYVYAFTPDGKTMVVLSSYCEDGEKMVGAWGSGDPDAKWTSIGEIKLAGKEPDWETVPIYQPERKQRAKSVKQLVKGKPSNKIPAGEPEAEKIMG